MTTNPFTPSGTALARAAALLPDLRARTTTRWPGPSETLVQRVAATERLAPAAPLLALAWELARLHRGEAAENEALLHLGFSLLALGAEGTTSVPASGTTLRTMLDLTAPGAKARPLLDAMLSGNPVPPGLAAFIGPSGDRPLLLTDGVLRLHRFDRSEERLADALATLLEAAPLTIDAGGLAEALRSLDAARRGVTLTAEQRLAVLNAAHLPLSVVTGGPGTGKTTIVVALLRLLVRLGVDPGRIALAAPTGKAANRLYQVVREQLEGQEEAPDRELLARLPEPRTLHRLLGYAPSTDRFRHDESHPLDADVVVVDECSMVDLFLMDQLLRACRPRDDAEQRVERGLQRRLVLLGDGDQLPSVEAGIAFRELSKDGTADLPALRRPWHAGLGTEQVNGVDRPRLVDPPAGLHAGFLTTLTRSHRMDPSQPEGRAIYECALAVRDGDLAALGDGGAARPPVTTQAESLVFSAVEQLDASLGKHAPEEFFRVWWERRLRRVEVGQGRSVEAASLWGAPFRFEGGRVVEEDADRLRALLAASESQRILCLTKGDEPSGAERANRWFASHRARLAQLAKRSSHRLVKGFAAGEPVLFVQNDYGLGLFNGDHGVVAWSQRDGGRPELRVVFERLSGPQDFDIEEVRPHLQRAYALTVHKAQGSQMDSAALLLPHDVGHPLLVRELVYTAVSRARRSVVVVGDWQRFVEAADKPVVRHGGVLAKTRALLAKS